VVRLWNAALAAAASALLAASAMLGRLKLTLLAPATAPMPLIKPLRVTFIFDLLMTSGTTRPNVESPHDGRIGYQAKASAMMFFSQPLAYSASSLRWSVMAASLSILTGLMPPASCT
jgi:hypothetical protein